MTAPMHRPRSPAGPQEGWGSPPGEAMLWFEGLIPTLGTGQGEEQKPCGWLPTARLRGALPCPNRSPGFRQPHRWRQPARGSPGSSVTPRRAAVTHCRAPLISRLPDVAKRVPSFRLGLEVPSSQAAANPQPSALVSLPGTRPAAARLVTPRDLLNHPAITKGTGTTAPAARPRQPRKNRPSNQVTPVFLASESALPSSRRAQLCRTFSPTPRGWMGLL